MQIRVEIQELADMDEKNLCNATNESNQTVKLYQGKNDEFA